MNEDGAYIYEGSVTEKEPKGKQITLKHAMSLSKQYWSPKAKNGAHEDLYTQFEAEYVPPVREEEDDKSVATESSSKKIVRMTAAEKEAEKAAKEAAKEAEKAAKKAAKEAEKEAKKAAVAAAKEAEKEAKKAAKEAEKAAAGKGKAATKAPVTAAAAKKAGSVASAAEKPAAAAAAAPKKAVAAKKDDWSCENDGMVHAWTYKGKKYARNYDNQVWEMEEDGSIGDWAGVYMPKSDKIDDSVPEPEIESDEE
jgi:membrane protein involved in colicin uptake